MEPLSTIRIAKSCPISWDEMSGTETVRHCSLCDCNVYNLSGMSRDDANRLILETEGRICARYYQRADGFVLTRDCPLGGGSEAVSNCIVGEVQRPYSADFSDQRP